MACHLLLPSTLVGDILHGELLVCIAYAYDPLLCSSSLLCIGVAMTSLQRKLPRVVEVLWKQLRTLEGTRELLADVIEDYVSRTPPEDLLDMFCTSLEPLQRAAKVSLDCRHIPPSVAYRM